MFTGVLSASMFGYIYILGFTSGFIFWVNSSFVLITLSVFQRLPCYIYNWVWALLLVVDDSIL